MAWEAWLTFQSERKAQYPGLNFEHEIPVGTSLQAVETAVAALIERHEVLRTMFDADEDGLPVQRVWSPEPVAVHELDLVADPDGVEAFKTRDFAIDTEWPCRFAVVTRGDGKAALLACFSHIALDDLAREILMRDFSEIWDAALSNRAPELRPVECQPLDYAVYERSEKTRALRERSKRYWQNKLDEMPVTTADLDEVPEFTRYVDCRRHSLSAGLRLERIASRIGVPMSAVFTAVFSVAVNGATSTEVLPLEVASHGRVTSNALNVVAPLVRDVIMPVALQPDQSFDDLAREVHRLAFEAVRYSMVDTLAFSEWKTLAGSGKGGEIGSRISLNFMHKTGNGRGDDGAHADPESQWYSTLSDPVEYRGYSHHLHASAGVSTQHGLELFVSGSEAIFGRSGIEAVARSITDLLESLDGSSALDVGDLQREVAGSFADAAPDRESDAVSALLSCAGSANGLPSMDAERSYVEGGGEFVRIPAVIRLLRDRGYEGLDWRDFRSHRSLATLSARLTSTSAATFVQD
jgi:hypothetical protein